MPLLLLLSLWASFGETSESCSTAIRARLLAGVNGPVKLEKSVIDAFHQGAQKFREEFPKLSENDRLKAHETLIVEASFLLRAQGVEHAISLKLGPRSVIEIRLPAEGSSPNLLNSTLAGIRRQNPKTKFIYDPLHLSEQDAYAIFDIQDNRIYLAHNSINFANSADHHNRSFFHELRHWKTWERLKKKEPFAFYGSIRGQAFEGAYGNYMHFDELNTWRFDVGAVLSRLENGQGAAFRDHQLDYFESKITTLRELTERTLEVLQDVELALKKTQPDIVGMLDYGIAEARVPVKVLDAEGKPIKDYVFTMPLVGSSNSLAPARLDQLLKNQLESLKKAAESQLSELPELESRYQRLLPPQNSAP